MNTQCLILAVTATLGQRLESRDRTCDEDFVCKPIHQCPLYQEKVGQLGVLGATDGVEYENLLSSFKHLICNQPENGICCEEKYEIVSGQIVENVEDMPFIARIHLKTGPGTSNFCGAAIIASQYLLTAKHCLTTFWTKCIEEKDCVARFRDLVRKDLYRNIENHEKGQFHIPIVEIFERPGRSDLAVVQLKHPIEEHEDYGLGAELIPIKLAEDPPESGDVILSSFLIIDTYFLFHLQVVQTGGWGVTGYNEGPSSELRSINLTITTVSLIPVYVQLCFFQIPCRCKTFGFTQALMTKMEESWTLARETQADHLFFGVTGDGSWSAFSRWLLCLWI